MAALVCRAKIRGRDFLDRTSTQGQFSKDSVKIVIASHYLFSNVDFFGEIRLKNLLILKD